MANLLLDRGEHALILRSENTVRWFGLLFFAFSLLWTIGAVNSSNHADAQHLIGFAVGSAFMAIGGLMMLPWTFTTVFDLRRRRILIETSFGYGWFRRSTAYTFDDITGIGFITYDEGDRLPVLKLRNGQTRKLTILLGLHRTSEDSIAAICAATGLPKIADAQA